jgi:hypothetical protein
MYIMMRETALPRLASSGNEVYKEDLERKEKIGREEKVHGSEP